MLPTEEKFNCRNQAIALIDNLRRWSMDMAIYRQPPKNIGCVIRKGVMQIPQEIGAFNAMLPR